MTDFSPVAACTNLEFFDAAGTALDSLDVIRGRKLHTLMIAWTRVTDLSVLAGMPLKKVDLEGTPVTDLGPLLQCQTLQSLVLPPNARNVAALRNLPSLVALSYDCAGFGESKQSAAEFWKKYDESGDGANPGRAPVR